IVELCRSIGHAVREGYTIKDLGDEIELIINGHSEWKAPQKEFDRLSELIIDLMGVSVGSRSGSDWTGSPVLPNEIAFKLGLNDSSKRAAKAVDSHRRASPKTLFIDDGDVRSLGLSPAYILFELQHCATKVL